MKIEHKLLDVSAAEFKFDGATGEFEGYASVFNDVDSYGDTSAPGAYKNTLQSRERSVKMRWNHFGPVIGKWLKMEEDEKGLFVRGQLTPGHSVASDVHASLKHGAIDGLSIGFFARGYEEDEDGKRTLTDIELVEVSVVEEPADLNARIANVKTQINEAETLHDLETVLRDAGLSRAASVSLVSKVKSIVQSDSEQEKKDQSDSEASAFLQRINQINQRVEALS